MPDRPAKSIAFQDWEVRAILDGRKTQKRVPMRRQPPWDEADMCWYYPHKDARSRACWDDDHDPTNLIVPFFFDSYWPGDVLWVQEAWALANRGCVGLRGTRYYYRATDGPCTIEPHWQPSSRMPRVASRWTLRVTDVRVQRVQNISPEDVVAEGCGTLTEYKEHWSERYTRRGVTWRDNPWVRALTFEVER